MLDTLYFVDDIMKRYKCRSKDTARRYMRQMGALGTPMFVTEDMIMSWEETKVMREKNRPVRRKPVPVVMEIPKRK